MNPRRILFVADTAKGGAAFSLYYLVKELAKQQELPVVLFYARHPYIPGKLAGAGIQTIFVEDRRQADDSPPDLPAGPVKQRDIAAWLEARLGKRAGRLYVFLKALYLFLRKDVPKVWPIWRTIRTHKIDLVHVNTGLRHGKPGVVAARLAGVPCVSHVRMFHELNDFDRLFQRWVTTFIYISCAVRDDCLAQGIRPGKGVVIHNAVDLAEFSSPPDAAAVRREFGLADRERPVGVIGRLDDWKGHDTFLEAIARVKQRLPDVRGFIIGAAEKSARNRAYFQRLQELVRALELEDTVIFTGFRSDIPRLMAALDVLVLSSSAPEPFGRVVIEGMAAGRPVVATAAGGVLDIVEDGATGLLVPAKNSAAMAGAILRLLLNPDLAREIGAAARKQAADKFTVQAQAAAVRRVYDRLAGSVPEPLVSSVKAKGMR